ncbi:unnamed protein product [Blepharisma stoltei]|uniref:Exosome complex component CSL4 C-terminal domain-containing protein n=1 Tax=Blepharisma stoltei TaxID=1481888 RepID=A0AAU9IXG7_9CILI|nr:unnamed protein product [Blepharisma stoltei]
MLFPGSILPDMEGGEGTYKYKNSLRATVCGDVSIENGHASVINKGQIIPRIGNIVLCRIVKLTLNNAQANILAVEERALKGSFLGIIRLSDVRKHEIEKLQIDKCFQPGDIVKARIISLGDAKSFYLSTAETELGVVLAWNNGERLMPYNWEEMIDLQSSQRFPRKVAKPLITS